MVALVIVSQAAALFGDLVLPGIVDRYPAMLIALNPRNRNLALATNQLSDVTFYAVGFARLVASDPLYYLLGYWFGERAIAWTERRSRTYGPFIRDGERLFRQASYPLIFLAPNSIICALAAATGVRLRAFIILNIGGTITRLILVRQLGALFSSPLEGILDLIAEYRVPLLILSAIGVAWTIFGEFRGDNSELKNLRHLEEEAEAEIDARTASGDETAGQTAEPGSVEGDAGSAVGTDDRHRNGSASGIETPDASDDLVDDQLDSVVSDLSDELLQEIESDERTGPMAADATGERPVDSAQPRTPTEQVE